MTAEVAIMNKGAVALAADSAVTLDVGEGRKVFYTAEKLFTLSKYHPVGIMEFGNAEFMGVPWETVIKIYRDKLGQRSFDALEDYAGDFIRFLEDENPLFPDAQEEEHVKWAARTIFGGEIREKIEEELQSASKGRERLDERKVRAIVASIIDNVCRRWESARAIPGIPSDYGRTVVKRYAGVFDKVRDEVFEGLPLSDAARERLRRICLCMFSKAYFHPQLSSGVVIAGFGQAEPFPSVVWMEIEAIVNKRLKYARQDHDRITFEVDASILPFAQREMVDAFMAGVHSDYQEKLENSLAELLANYRQRLLDTLKELRPKSPPAIMKRWESVGNQLLNHLSEQLKQYRQEMYVNPVIGAVAALPKGELAAMAEALVNLTSFKRRISLEFETVGGSIDVAVISKGDGFVWVKRKQYASQELNPHLFAST